MTSHLAHAALDYMLDLVEGPGQFLDGVLDLVVFHEKFSYLAAPQGPSPLLPRHPLDSCWGQP